MVNAAVPEYYLDSGDLNLGPYIHTTSALPSESAPETEITSKFKLTLLLLIFC